MIHKFKFEDTNLEGAKIITPFIADDERGSFVKDYSKEVFEENGIAHNLKEVFYTESKKGVVRAIHFQRVKEQAKLVRCIYGHIYDVIVDLRPDSKTFGMWQGFDLKAEEYNQIFIPEHFGHGYLVLEDSIVAYKCGEKFYAEYDDGIIWNDPDLSIQWPLNLIEELILSEKDKNLQSFMEFKQNLIM